MHTVFCFIVITTIETKGTERRTVPFLERELIFFTGITVLTFGSVTRSFHIETVVFTLTANIITTQAQINTVKHHRWRYEVMTEIPFNRIQTFGVVQLTQTVRISSLVSTQLTNTPWSFLVINRHFTNVRHKTTDFFTNVKDKSIHGHRDREQLRQCGRFVYL